MTSFNHETEIAAPIEYVFEWGTTPENWQRSTPSLIDYEVLEETDEGTRYRNTFRMLGRSVTSEELFTLDEDNWETVSVFDDDDMSGELRFTYTEVDEGTLVRLHGDIETGGSLFDRALRPVVTRYMNRQFGNTLQTMKELIEAEFAETEPEAVQA